MASNPANYTPAPLEHSSRFLATDSLPETDASVILGNTAQLAYRLQQITTFVRSAKQILLCKMLPDEQFIYAFAKIIELVELSKQTLESSGILLYSFSYCPLELAKHKKIYYDLLAMIEAKRNLVLDDKVLQSRISRLIRPLHPSCVISYDKDPFSDFFGRKDASSSPSLGQSRCANEDSLRMPPPDAFKSPPKHEYSTLERKNSLTSRAERCGNALDIQLSQTRQLVSPECDDDGKCLPTLSTLARRHGQLWNKRRPLNGRCVTSVDRHSITQDVNY